jgi:hypothetical protein
MLSSRQLPSGSTDNHRVMHITIMLVRENSRSSCSSQISGFLDSTFSLELTRLCIEYKMTVTKNPIQRDFALLEMVMTSQVVNEESVLP